LNQKIGSSFFSSQRIDLVGDPELTHKLLNGNWLRIDFSLPERSALVYRVTSATERDAPDRAKFPTAESICS